MRKNVHKYNTATHTRYAFQSSGFRLTVNTPLIRTNSFYDKIRFVSQFQLGPKNQFHKPHINAKTGNLRKQPVLDPNSTPPRTPKLSA